MTPEEYRAEYCSKFDELVSIMAGMAAEIKKLNEQTAEILKAQESANKVDMMNKIMRTTPVVSPPPTKTPPLWPSLQPAISYGTVKSFKIEDYIGAFDVEAKGN